jgi:aminodeoxyfutalosine deaminase
MFDTDLTRDYAAATSLGLSPRVFYEAGVAGALCDAGTKALLRAIGDAYDWSVAGLREKEFFVVRRGWN